MTKSECLDLPEIVEKIRTVDLEPKALKLYDSIEDESYAEMEESEVTTANILTRLLRLSQIIGGHLTDDDGIVNSVSTAKLDALSDIIDTCMICIVKAVMTPTPMLDSEPRSISTDSERIFWLL